MKKRFLGDILLEMGAIDELQLNAALAHHRQWGVPLGKALVDKKLCNPDHVFTALARQTGLPAVYLRAMTLDARLAPLIPVKIAQQHHVVPLRTEGRRAETLVVAIAAPASLGALDAVQSVTGKQRVVAHLATDEDIADALYRIYGIANPYADVKTRSFGPAQVANENEVELGETEAPAVLLFGWPDAAGNALVEVLRTAGLSSALADEAAVQDAVPGTVVFAPLPAIDAAVKNGLRSPAALIVAGRDPVADHPRAQKLGARGFLPAPIESELLLHVIRRVTRQLRSNAA